MSEENPKEATSIAKRNLRLVKRIALGKEKPPIFLRILCWIHLAWGVLMFVFFMFNGLLMNTSLMKGVKLDTEIQSLGGKFFVSYAMLHLFALLGVILMWRIKKTGFYIYTASAFIMPFLPIFFTGSYKVDLYTLLFSLVSIGLFALNWRLFNRK